jgi:nitroreductase
MDTAIEQQIGARWSAFRSINANRRAIREFDERALADETVRELLEQALLAPSSGNLQTYEFHWVRTAQKKAAVAAACEGQRAAMSAATLIVVVASRESARRSAESMRRYVETTDGLDDKSKQYHFEKLRKVKAFLRIAPLMFWSPLKGLLCLLFPALTLMPVGSAGIRHWTARSSIFAAQTLLLAASARGIDSCPMEGFSARKVAKALDLPRGSVIPVVIALGQRREDARVEPRWRRALDEAVVVH